MSDDEEKLTSDPLPAQTLEAVAKTIYRQAQEYGFSRQDFIRFVNILLDLGMERSGVYVPPPSVGLADVSGSAESIYEHEPAEAKDISVRVYTEEDHALLAKWVGDEVGRLFLTTRINPSRDNTLETLLADKTNVFGIVSLEGRPIGALAYLNVDPEQGKAELRKLIGDPAARGRGYAKLATQYWIEYGVSTLGLRKIYVHTIDTNLANIRLNEQLGFRVEGLLREEVFLDGQYHDVLRMSLILPR